MQVPVLCKICGIRKARRHCPAVGGEICTICCGTEREVSLLCPLSCEYLKEAHRHEKPAADGEPKAAYPDVALNEDLLQNQAELILFSIHSLWQAGLQTEGAVDSDVMQALEALIQTRRTLKSGLIYETRPVNPIAASIQQTFASSLDEFEREQEEHEDLGAARNRDPLPVLVFLHHVGQRHRSERPKSRIFLDVLSQMAPETGANERAPGIVI